MTVIVPSLRIHVPYICTPFIFLSCWAVCHTRPPASKRVRLQQGIDKLELVAFVAERTFSKRGNKPGAIATGNATIQTKLYERGPQRLRQLHVRLRRLQNLVFVTLVWGVLALLDPPGWKSSIQPNFQ